MPPIRSSHLLLALGCLVLPVPGAFGQGDNGFLRGKGHTDVALTYSYDYYDTFWVGTDEVAMAGVGEITRETYNLWIAHGLREDLDLFISGSLVEAESDGEGAGVGFPDRVKDMQDFTAGVKWRFLHEQAMGGHFSLLAAPSVKVPMGTYEDDTPTAIGDGQVDLRGRLIAQYTHASGTFLAVESGYDRRNGVPDDEIPLNVTLGATWGDLTVTPYYSLVHSQGGYDISDLPQPGGFPGVREEFERAGISAYYRIHQDIGVTGGWRTTLDGRNTGNADTLMLGLVLRF